MVQVSEHIQAQGEQLVVEQTADSQDRPVPNLVPQTVGLPEDKVEWWEKIAKSAYPAGYSHFDSRAINLMSVVGKTDDGQDLRLYEWVRDPANISKHTFLPLIQSSVDVVKAKRFSDEDKLDPTKEKQIGHNLKLRSKVRELYHASHFDRCIYQYYSFVLNQYYDKWAESHGISDAAIAYRFNDSNTNVEYAKQAFDHISEFDQCLVIVSDFSSFFDYLDEGYLKQNLCEVLGVERLPDDWFAVFKSLTKRSWIRIEDIATLLKASLKSAPKAKNGPYPCYSINEINRSDLVPDIRTLKKMIQEYNAKLESAVPEAILAVAPKKADHQSGVASMSQPEPSDSSADSLVVKADANVKTETERSIHIMNYKRLKEQAKSEKERLLADRGVPQGVSMSVTLSNVYMIQFDEMVKQLVTGLGGYYMRYADDIIIMLPFNNANECQDLYQIVWDCFANFQGKVIINEDKTDKMVFINQACYAFEQGEVLLNKKRRLPYLGFSFDGTYVYMRQAGVTKYYYRMYRKAKGFFKQCKYFYNRRPHNLYTRYAALAPKYAKGLHGSDAKLQRNYISYLVHCKKVFGDRLNDPQVNALLLRSRQRITKTIKGFVRREDRKFQQVMDELLALL